MTKRKSIPRRQRQACIYRPSKPHLTIKDIRRGLTCPPYVTGFPRSKRSATNQPTSNQSQRSTVSQHVMNDDHDLGGRDDSPGGDYNNAGWDYVEELPRVDRETINQANSHQFRLQKRDEEHEKILEDW